jgi:hypothetical protein
MAAVPARTVARTRVRLERRVRDELARLRAAPVAIASGAALVLVTAVLIATATQSEGWPGILKGFAANAVTGAVLAGFAYLLFVLRFRRARLSEYLTRFRGDDAGGGGPVARVAHDALVETVVKELLTARPPRSCLLVGPPDIARRSAIEELPGLLAASKRVPVVVDVGRESSIASIPERTRQQFVTGLVGSSGDDTSGGRVFAYLAGRQHAVAVVAGLDSLSEGLSKRARRKALEDLLRGCLTERLPVVATLSDDLVPPLSEMAVLRIPPASAPHVASRLCQLLRDRGQHVDDALEQHLAARLGQLDEPTRDPFLLGLAADLVAARAKQSRTSQKVLDDLFEDPAAFRRHVGWICEWALGCTLREATSDQSAVAFALRTIGVEAHYRQDLPTTWADATRGLGEEDQRLLAAGVSELTQKGVLSLSGDGGGAVLSFAHAGWLAFAGALGMGVARERWGTLLRPGASQATLDALTVALVLAGPRPERSFLGVLHRVAEWDENAVSLDVALALIATLQLDGGPVEIGDREAAALNRSWRASNDTVRLKFLADVHFDRSPLLVDFLWEQVIPPAFNDNAFRVRRAACARLSALGPVAWDQLGREWRTLAKDALGRSLSASTHAERGGDWDECGWAVESLAWLVPSLLIELEGERRKQALDLLADLRAVARDGWDGATPLAEASDVGIEISLAEGFKIAAMRAVASRPELEDWWWEEARDFFESAQSWVSEQALLQALALADRNDRRVGKLARWTADSTSRHPFVRETAALVLSDVEAPDGATARQQYVWLDDQQALHDGGLELVPAAHRLLGLSTLLINFAENAATTRASGAASRVKAFTSDELPRCFSRPGHAATMYDFECDCEFGLCGPKARGPVGLRVISSAFAKRAEATADAALAAEGGLFARRAFRDVWRALDDDLAKARDA